MRRNGVAGIALGVLVLAALARVPALAGDAYNGKVVAVRSANVMVTIGPVPFRAAYRAGRLDES